MGLRRMCAVLAAAAAISLCAPAIWAQTATTPPVYGVQRPGTTGISATAATKRNPASQSNPAARGASAPASSSSSVMRPAPARPQIRYSNGLLSIWAENSTLADVLAGVRQKTGALIDAPPGASNERVAVNLGPAPANEVLTKLLNGSRFDYIILDAPQQPARVERVILQEKQGGNAAGAANNVANNSVNQAAPQPQPAEDNGDAGIQDNDVPEEVQQQEPAPGSPGAQQPGAPEQQQSGTKTPEQLLEELKQMQIQQQQQQQQQPQNQQPQPPQQQTPQVQPPGQPQIRPQMQMQMQPQPPQAEMPPEIESPPPTQPE